VEGGILGGVCSTDEAVVALQALAVARESVQ
jgi:hypothetical protein